MSCPRCLLSICLLLVVFVASNSWADEIEKGSPFAVVERLVERSAVAGAQVVLGEGDAPIVSKCFGVRDVRDGEPVNDQTRFCIGSCSKMFAAAVLVSLADEGVVDLDGPIDRWLDDYAALKLNTGEKAKRAPTLRELLSHRGGMYSQRDRLTRSQNRWIRDFRLSLAESVDGIAKEPLGFEPGEDFAYSGAGYCVLGRVAEVAAKKPFDELLKQYVSGPLKLPSTTYFPPADNENIAVGHTFSDGKLTIVPQTPHLLREKNKLALVGGSIYAPAREAAEFARMLLGKGTSRGREVLSLERWRELTTPPAEQSNGYALGITVRRDADSGEVQMLSHGGALFGSFSFLVVDVQSRRYAVATYTGRRDAAINEALQQWVQTKPEVVEKAP